MSTFVTLGNLTNSQKNISIFNKNSPYEILFVISYFSYIFGNWESVIIDEKSLGKFTGEIFNVHYYFAPKNQTSINAMQNQFPKMTNSVFNVRNC